MTYIHNLIQSICMHLFVHCFYMRLGYKQKGKFKIWIIHIWKSFCDLHTVDRVLHWKEKAFWKLKLIIQKHFYLVSNIIIPWATYSILYILNYLYTHACLVFSPRGGTDLERGYGDVRPWRPPFHATPVVRKGPISSKRVSSQDPLLRKFGNFSLYSLNFCPNFSSQAPKFSSAHKPPNLEIFSSQAPSFRGKYQFASPTLRKSGSHTPTWKKVECHPWGFSMFPQ